jgi:branched-chain amino acid transport system substrate-binding protein
VIVLVGALVMGCAPAATPAPAPEPEPEPTEAPAPGKPELPAEIVLPVMGPYTGFYPAAGEDFKQGTEMAVAEINEAGGIRGSMLKLEFFDTQMTPTEAANLARTVVADERFPLLIGPWSSSSCLAVLPILEEAGMVMWTPSASSAQIAESPWGFKISTDNQIYGSLMAELAVSELGHTKIGIIYAQNDYAMNQRSPQQAVIESLGGEVVADEGFTPDTTDFRPILSKIDESGAEALLLNCYSQEGALIINQARELGMDTVMVGDGVFMDDAFFDVVGENAKGLYAITGEGAVAAMTDPTKLRQKVRDYNEAFEERYDELPQTWEDAAYDVVYVTAHVIDQVGMDRAAIRDALETVSGINTVTVEDFTMGKLHWPIVDLKYYVWEDGAYQFIKDAPETDYLPR